MLFTQVAASYRPRKVGEMVWDQGSGGSAAGYKAIYVMGELLAAGTLANGDVSMLTNADDAASKFGAGSFGAFYAAQVFRGGGLLCRVYGVGVTEPAGVAATQTYIFATSTTSAGVITVNVAGAVFSFSVDSGADPTAAGDAMVAAFALLSIDQKPPVTLANAAGTVTATMNNKGAIANSAPSYQIVTGDEPAAMTLTVAGCCFGIGGAPVVAGTLYPTLTTALTNLTTVVTPCLLHPWDETPDGSTKPADLTRAHMETKTNAEVGHRGSVFASTAKSSATIVSDILALDDSDAERYRLAAIGIDIATNSPPTWHPAAGAYMAHAWGEVLDPAHPYDNVALPHMAAPPDSSDILTTDEVDVLLEGGACCLNYDKDRGRYLMVKGVGCRLFSGKPQPWAIVDSGDWVRFNYLTNLAATFPAGTKLAEDGEDNLDENTTTPAGVLDVWHATIFDRNMRGILRNREETFTASYAEINASFADRVDLSGDYAVMCGLSVVASLLRQRAGILTVAE